MMVRRVDWMGEALKALRSSWLTASEFAQAVGSSTQPSRVELDEMVALGIAVGRERSNRDARAAGQGSGVNPMEYTLSKVWGGNG